MSQAAGHAGLPGNSSLKASSLSNSHGLTHHNRTPGPSSTDDVGEVEELDESPNLNPQSQIELPDRSLWRSSSTLRAESYFYRSATNRSVTYHPLSVHVLALLMSFSVLGTLARLGINALGTYDGQSIFPLAWVQALGCGIMGFTIGLREPITQFYGPLYTAITAGFCGSLTTFSGWQLSVFQAWANAAGRNRLWIYNVMDGLTQTLFTFAASLGSFDLGAHLGRRVAPRARAPSSPSSSTRWTLTMLSIVLYIMTVPIFIWLNLSWRPLATAALVFSFPGTFTRYILSTYLNTRSKKLPWGTLTANTVAIALLAAFHIIQRAPKSPAPISCSILQGFIDGYCGCMSTVSSFAAEIRVLSSRKAWVYVGISFTLGQIILLIMMGPAWWSGQIKEEDLCRFV